MLPRERELVERLKDRPFTLLGINSDQSRSALQKNLVDEKITWPNIFDGPAGQGPVANTWNVHSWPTIYLIDAVGVIRAKNVSEEGLEKEIEELLKTTP